MKNTLTYAVFVLALAGSAAWANPVSLRLYDGLQLRSAGADEARPDLTALPGQLYAPKGIRLQGSDQFKDTLAVHPGALYVVNDLFEHEHTIRVVRLDEGAVQLDVLPANAPNVIARYKNREYRDGSLVMHGLPDLVLFSDGTYALGRAQGSWSRYEGGYLALDGYYGSWGLGSEKGNQLTFTFWRGSNPIHVRLERVPGPGPLLTAR